MSRKTVLAATVNHWLDLATRYPNALQVPSPTLLNDSTRTRSELKAE